MEDAELRGKSSEHRKVGELIDQLYHSKDSLKEKKAGGRFKKLKFWKKAEEQSIVEVLIQKSVEQGIKGYRVDVKTAFPGFDTEAGFNLEAPPTPDFREIGTAAKKKGLLLVLVSHYKAVTAEDFELHKEKIKSMLDEHKIDVDDVIRADPK